MSHEDPVWLGARAVFFLLAPVLLLVAWSGEAEACLHTAYRTALADMDRLSAFDKFYAAYFWLGDVPQLKRTEFIRTFAGHLNQLSREPKTYFPQVVAVDMSLLRVNTSKYAWPITLNKLLAEAHSYNTTQIELLNVPWPGGIWLGDGKQYESGSFPITKLTIPVVGARWFVWQTLRNNDRNPNYYSFLGITSKKDIDNLSGFSADLQKKSRRSDWIEVPRFSGISTTYLRNVLIQPVLEGRRYVTEDSKVAKAEFNPLRIVDREFAKHDAEEIIGFLPNNFLFWGLASAAGELQNSAPDFVGFDRSSRSNDGRIEPVGCLGCHYQKAFGGSAGLIDFTPHFRDMLSKLNQMSPDYERLLKFEPLYLRPFVQQMAIDRLIHNQAVLDCTGMSADVWAQKLTGYFWEYDNGATLAEAALQLGCDAKVITGPQLKLALQQYAHDTGQLDQVLGLFAIGEKIPRVQYHEVYPALYGTYRGMLENAKPLPLPDVGKLLAPAVSAADSGKQPLWGSGKLQLPKLPGKLQLPGGAADLRTIRGAAVQPGVRKPGNGGKPPVHAANADGGNGGGTVIATGAVPAGRIPARPVRAAVGERGDKPAGTGAGGQVGSDRVGVRADSRAAGGPAAARGAAGLRHPAAVLCGMPQRYWCQGKVHDVRPRWAAGAVVAGHARKDRGPDQQGDKRPGKDAVGTEQRVELRRAQTCDAWIGESTAAGPAGEWRTTAAAATTGVAGEEGVSAAMIVRWITWLVVFLAIVVCVVAVWRDPTRYRY